jgi:hypothetical protein
MTIVNSIFIWDWFVVHRYVISSLYLAANLQKRSEKKPMSAEITGKMPKFAANRC